MTRADVHGIPFRQVDHFSSVPLQRIRQAPEASQKRQPKLDTVHTAHQDLVQILDSFDECDCPRMKLISSGLFNQKLRTPFLPPNILFLILHYHHAA